MTMRLYRGPACPQAGGSDGSSGDAHSSCGFAFYFRLENGAALPSDYDSGLCVYGKYDGRQKRRFFPPLPAGDRENERGGRRVCRGIPVVKVFQQTVYSFKAFYTAIQSYSDLASQYAMSCRNGQTSFLTCINGGFALLIRRLFFWLPAETAGRCWQTLSFTPCLLRPAAL